jgi:RNA polymerase sigma-70 factor (ECF subfamily)
MTHESIPQLRKLARRALERSLRPAAPPSNEQPDCELLARLQTALLSLPRRRRELFLAVRLDGASYADLANQTGLSAKKVECEVALALAQIDRCLERRKVAPLRTSWRRFWRR